MKIYNNTLAKWHFVTICCCLLCQSCVKYKSLVNFSDAPIYSEPQAISNFSPMTIQVNDLLNISISSAELEAVEPFNKMAEKGYLVAIDGTIEFPIIGKLAVEGKTIEESKELFREQLNKYFVKPPGVHISLANFKIVVNGEVTNPSVFQVNSERVTIIDAITMAGDFTNYSRRDSILVIREQGGIRTFGHVNFNNIDIINSPYYYLRQNDIIYVRPEKSLVGNTRDQASKYIPWVGAVVSLILLMSNLLRNR